MIKKILLVFLSLMMPLAAGQKRPEHHIDKELKTYAKQLKSQHQMELIGLGVSSLIGKGDLLYAMSFTHPGKLTLEEGKKLAKEISTTLMHEMPKKKLFIDYYAIVNEFKKNELPQDKWLGYKISFWDEDVNRPLYPYLAQIRFAQKKVFFYYADPKTQALSEPIEIKIETLLCK